MKFIFNELLIEIFNSDFSNVPFDNKTFQKFYSLLMIKNIIQSTKIQNVCTTSKIAEFEKSLRNAEHVVALFNSDSTRNLFEYQNVDKHLICENDFVLMNGNDNTDLYNSFKERKLFFNNSEDFFAKKFRNHDIFNITIKGNDLSTIKNRIPPLDNLLIVDQYFASNTINNCQLLINFILFFKKESNPIDIIIIYGNSQNIHFNNELYINFLENMKKSFLELKEINIKFYFIPNLFHGRKRIKDRYFFTNYTYSVIGHPIQDLNTYFAQKMIFNSDTVEELDLNLKTYTDKLKLFKDYLKKTKPVYSYNSKNENV